MNTEDLMNASRMEEKGKTIKKDFLGFASHNGNVRNGTEGKNSLLFTHDTKTVTKDTERKHFAIKKNRIRIKVSQNIGERQQEAMTTNTLGKAPHAPLKVIDPIGDDEFYQNSGSPERFSTTVSNSNSATRPIQFSDAASLHHKNHYRGLIPLRNVSNHHQNRFYINQNGNELDKGILIENVTRAGVIINDPNSRKLNAHISRIGMKSHQSVGHLTGDDDYRRASHHNFPAYIGIHSKFNPKKKPQKLHNKNMENVVSGKLHIT